ncbi:hypothetical protein AB0F44_08335 [Nocardioides sp. NPDC023903]|uniref:hypothetical protein n=1 Tax=Nocardioides sp. NPDC023903 TaxID=3157195 RepID=UPI0033F54EFA
MAAVVLGGCGGDPEGTSESATPSPSPTESTAPSEQPGETQAVEVNGAQLEVPADWIVTAPSTSERATLGAPKDASGHSYGSGIFNSDITLADDTEDLAESQSRVAPKAKRLADVTFAGQTFFHFRELEGAESLDTYGTVIDGSEVTVAWGFNSKLATREQIDEYINQVMPSFKFVG